MLDSLVVGNRTFKKGQLISVDNPFNKVVFLLAEIVGIFRWGIKIKTGNHEYTFLLSDDKWYFRYYYNVNGTDERISQILILPYYHTFRENLLRCLKD